MSTLSCIKPDHKVQLYMLHKSKFVDSNHFFHGALLNLFVRVFL